MFHENDKVPILFNEADSIRRLLNYSSSKEQNIIIPIYSMNCWLLYLIVFNCIYYNFQL